MDILASEAINSDSFPANYEQFAGEILVANGDPPRWFTRLPYVAVVLALASYFHVRPLDPVNTVFAVLFVIWLVYTPITNSIDAGPVMVQTGRAPVNDKLWGRILALGVDAKTLSFYLGIHEYEG